MKYELKTRGEQEFDSVITISGLTSDITINELLDNLENSQKILKETHSNAQLTEMFLKEAREKMPQLAEIAPEHLGLATQYFMKMGENRMAEELMRSCRESIDKYTTHLKAIEEATGIKCLPEIAPFQLEDFAAKDENDG